MSCPTPIDRDDKKKFQRHLPFISILVFSLRRQTIIGFSLVGRVLGTGVIWTPLHPNENPIPNPNVLLCSIKDFSIETYVRKAMKIYNRKTACRQITAQHNQKTWLCAKKYWTIDSIINHFAPRSSKKTDSSYSSFSFRIGSVGCRSFKQARNMKKK